MMTLMSTYQVLNLMFETLVVSLKNPQLDFLFYSPAAYSVIRKMLLLLLRIPKGEFIFRPRASAYRKLQIKVILIFQQKRLCESILIPV